jgi:hypothetical protein
LFFLVSDCARSEACFHADRGRTRLRAGAANDARKRSTYAHEPVGASGGKGGDSDEPPLQRRLRDGAAETKAVAPPKLTAPRALCSTGNAMVVDTVSDVDAVDAWEREMHAPA